MQTFSLSSPPCKKNLPHDTLDSTHNPIRIALVTARNAPADMRAIKTLREWGVNVDLAFFLGGIEKTRVLKTFAPHIFFDDSIKHINAAKNVVPSALVPYHSTSLLNQYYAPDKVVMDNMDNAQFLETDKKLLTKTKKTNK